MAIQIVYATEVVKKRKVEIVGGDRPDYFLAVDFVRYIETLESLREGIRIFGYDATNNQFRYVLVDDQGRLVVSGAVGGGTISEPFTYTVQQVSAANNTAGVEATLDTGNRTLLEVFVWASTVPYDIEFYFSYDGVDWLPAPELNVTGQTNNWYHAGFLNATRYVRVRVPTTGIDVKIVIMAKGL